MSGAGSPRQHGLRRASLPDAFTDALYACSPYRGCGHGCLYCDGRAEKYYVEGDFARDIVTRPWLPDVLARELTTLREWGALALGSGVTDVYQPCERSELLTRRIVEAVADMPDRTVAGGVPPLPVVVLTKSALILRDLDLWTRIDARAGVLVLVSITTLDDTVRRAFEPGASPLGERLEIFRACHAAGIATGALAMPFLPGITDDSRSITALMEALAGLGTTFVMPGGLTLRPGRQKECVGRLLAAHYPDLVALYARLYGENRASGSPAFAYRARLDREIGPIRHRLGLPRHVPHPLLRRLLAPHDELWVLFSQMRDLYAERGVDTLRLAEASDRYGAWLRAMRTTFRRRRTLPVSWLGERFGTAIETGELAQVLANDKLARFTERVARDRLVFDHETLALR